ncbi:fasciclin-like arabinogalactan protein 1 [Panicum virgatum]|nr:fasciclin-like arabinogalactan protein 1 [Panicum virgatum]
MRRRRRGVRARPPPPGRRQGGPGRGEGEGARGTPGAAQHHGAHVQGRVRAFASLLAASPDALSAFRSAVEGGVTAFGPTDAALRPFMPSYRNLSADGRASLLLFHAVPVYYTVRGLKSSNGPMNTLATDGSSRDYNFTVQNVGDQVSIRTAASGGAAAARVRGTVYDRDPVAIYALDAVLEPVELFDPAEAPAPAPAPAADAPRASGKRARHRQRHVADAPGPAADDDAAPADQRKNAKKNAAPGAPRPRWLAAVAAAAAAALV